MATNYTMNINLSKFIDARIIENEDNNGVSELGIFIPIAKNCLTQYRGNVYFNAFVTEKMYDTGDNKSHYIKQKVTKEHIKKLNDLGYESPFLGSLRVEKRYAPSFQSDAKYQQGRVKNID